MLEPPEPGKKDNPPLLRIETLLIICQQHGAACGRLRGLGEEEIVFSPHNNHLVADRFSAGFRWDGGFINIDELEKIREDNGGTERIIRARIRKIGPADKTALMKLLNGTRLATAEAVGYEPWVTGARDQPNANQFGGQEVCEQKIQLLNITKCPS